MSPNLNVNYVANFSRSANIKQTSKYTSTSNAMSAFILVLCQVNFLKMIKTILTKLLIGRKDLNVKSLKIVIKFFKLSYTINNQCHHHHHYYNSPFIKKVSIIIISHLILLPFWIFSFHFSNDSLNLKEKDTNF